MKNTKPLFVLLLLIFSFIGFAQTQNLVKNGGLEQHSRCPYTLDQIKFAEPWSAIDTFNHPEYFDTFGSPNCSPEYCHVCGSLPYGSVPLNSFFNHIPHSGSGMAQVMMYSDDTTTMIGSYLRDYLQGRLTQNLVAGKQYCVSFFTLQEHGSAFNVNNIGAYMDNGAIDSVAWDRCGFPLTAVTPQVNCTSVISDTNSWTMIQGSFIANGSENYITIGNFFSRTTTTAIPTHSWRAAQLGNGVISLYLIDDVSVIPSDAVAYAGHDTAIHAGDTASIGVTENGDGMPCRWYTLGGTTAIDSGGTIKVHPATTTSYVVKMSLCGNITYDTVKVWVQPVGITSPRPSPREREVLLWPNPVGDELTITGAKDCVVEILDVLGECVHMARITANKETLNVAALPGGIYVVKVNGVNLQRLVK